MVDDRLRIEGRIPVRDLSAGRAVSLTVLRSTDGGEPVLQDMGLPWLGAWPPTSRRRAIA